MDEKLQVVLLVVPSYIQRLKAVENTECIFSLVQEWCHWNSHS